MTVHYDRVNAYGSGSVQAFLLISDLVGSGIMHPDAGMSVAVISSVR